MRRWNGWGDNSVTYSIPASATRFLENLIGPGIPPKEYNLQDVLASVPISKIQNHPLVSTNPLPRLLHARGQSFTDWIELRSGRVSSFPDGVACPETDEEIVELIEYARKANIHIIPYGGGTSVVGHINPIVTDAPTLTVDMS